MFPVVIAVVIKGAQTPVSTTLGVATVKADPAVALQ
jgi:hypothetical protein